MSKPDPFWLDQAGRKQLKLCTVQQIKYNLVIKIFCLLSMQQNNGSGKSCKEESNSLQAKPTVRCLRHILYISPLTKVYLYSVCCPCSPQPPCLNAYPQYSNIHSSLSLQNCRQCLVSIEHLTVPICYASWSQSRVFVSNLSQLSNLLIRPGRLFMTTSSVSGSENLNPHIIMFMAFHVLISKLYHHF